MGFLGLSKGPKQKNVPVKCMSALCICFICLSKLPGLAQLLALRGDLGRIRGPTPCHETDYSKGRGEVNSE